jgi:hypothetical protein
MAVLDFVNGQVFGVADFVIRSDGVCRLNPEMARMVVARVSAQKIYGWTAGGGANRHLGSESFAKAADSEFFGTVLDCESAMSHRNFR